MLHFVQKSLKAWKMQLYQDLPATESIGVKEDLKCMDEIFLTVILFLLYLHCHMSH